MPPPTPFAHQEPEEVTMAAAVGQSRPPQQNQELSRSGAPSLQIAGAKTYHPPSSRSPGQDGQRWTLQQLRATDAMIPSQSGTNQFASQQGMTGFGTPRNTSTPVFTTNPDLVPSGVPTEESSRKRYGKWTLEQLRATEAIVRPQSGTNQFASQKGMAIGASRDVRGKHLHRIWDGLFSEEVPAEQSDLQQYQYGP